MKHKELSKANKITTTLTPTTLASALVLLGIMLSRNPTNISHFTLMVLCLSFISLSMIGIISFSFYWGLRYADRTIPKSYDVNKEV